MLKIKDIKIDTFEKRGIQIIVTTEHTPGVKHGDIFIAEDNYFPLCVQRISSTEDILIPIGYWRRMYFRYDENSIEEISEIKNWNYKLATEKEKKNIEHDGCLL